MKLIRQIQEKVSEFKKLKKKNLQHLHVATPLADSILKSFCVDQ